MCETNLYVRAGQDESDERNLFDLCEPCAAMFTNSCAR